MSHAYTHTPTHTRIHTPLCHTHRHTPISPTYTHTHTHTHSHSSVQSQLPLLPPEAASFPPCHECHVCARVCCFALSPAGLNGACGCRIQCDVSLQPVDAEFN